MPQQTNPIQMIKNKIHNSSYNAKLRAEENGVYVCKDKKEKVFEFVPLEQVIIKGVTLEQYIHKEREELEKKISDLSLSVKTLKELVEALSKHIDNQRFL